MEVLVLGLPRTGTQLLSKKALADALNDLGYGPTYHMREVDKHGHREEWIAAVDRKLDGQMPYKRLEFDALLHGFHSIADVPGCIFVDELLAAYPEAKVILTIRSEDAWYDSVLATLWLTRSKPDWKPAPVPSLSDRWHEYFWKSDFPRNGRAAFQRHNDHVRSLVPSHQLLEYEVREGWGPLCRFLGCPVPKREFPRSDDWESKGWKGRVDAPSEQR